MVRVFLKGGIWKNSEDEILKAAVQKYGKQQWARVASLLNRKTAKQAKARWHEWLDPAIRKTEWSRAEEEKLLQLAKVMPAQWKTIAPLVGRTAVQCQEHYEYMLDQAAVSGGDNAVGNDTDALRKQQSTALLRPGQIDAHPESKPARPDPIDMDEDEMEMLQEARARLANTQGKKAKRKQRERYLAQAKRLADLQKRRELKQAGLLSQAARKKSKVRKQEIDLGVEIPFYKPAPAGFHDVAQERARGDALQQKRWSQVDYHKVNENQYRTRDREATQAKKRQENRLQMLQESNETYAKAKEKADELPATTFRGTLELPAPMDVERDTFSSSQSVVSGVGGPTAALTSDDSHRLLPTPMRRIDLVQEASTLRQLERGQTPLLTGAHGENDEDRKLPAVYETSTIHDDQSISGSTLASMSIRELARQERRQAQRARAALEAALNDLPAPQFEYELVAPEDENETMIETVTDAIEADQADVEAAALAEERKRAEKRYDARRTVVKRKDLPRPMCAEDLLHLPDKGHAVSDEMELLIAHDASAFPILEEKAKKKRKLMEPAKPLSTPVPLQAFSEQSLTAARHMIETEAEAIINEKVSAAVRQGKASGRDDALQFLSNANTEASISATYNMNFVPQRGWVQEASNQDRLAALKHEFSVVQEAAAALRKKNLKQTSKLSVVTGGYRKRAEKLVAESLRTHSELLNAGIEVAVYERLRQQETVGAGQRLNKLKGEVSILRTQEAELQKRYGELLVQKRRHEVQADHGRKA